MERDLGDLGIPNGFPYNPRICMLEHHRLAGLLSRIFEPTVVGGTAVTAGKAIPSDMLRFLSVCLR